MRHDHYVLALKTAFLADLALVIVVAVDFLFLEQRLVAPLVILYGILTTAIATLWALGEARESHRRQASTRPAPAVSEAPRDRSTDS